MWSSFISKDKGVEAASLYFRLYTTSLLNLLGDSISQLALPLAFLATSGSVVLAATLASSAALTQLLLSLPLAAIADRLPRKPVILFTGIIEACSLALLVYLLLTGQISFWPVILLGILRGTASQLGSAATAGYVPQLLGRDAMLHFNSRVETVEGIAAIAGPSLSGSLVSLLGGPLALFLPVTFTALNTLIYWQLPAQKPAAPSGTGKKLLDSILPDILQGISYVARSRLLVTMQLIQLALGISTAGYLYGVIVHLDSLALEPWLIGLVMAATGVGGILASLILEKFIPLEKSKSVLLSALAGVGSILIIFPQSSNIYLLSAGLLLLDFCWVAIFIYSGTLLQYVTDDDHLSRVDSISDLVFMAGSTLSLGLASWLASAGNPGNYLFVLGISLLPAFLALATLPADLLAQEAAEMEEES